MHKKKKADNELTVAQHLQELKKRLFCVAAWFSILFVALYLKSNQLLAILIGIGEDAGFTLGYTSPQEMFLQAIRVSAIGAFILSFPVVVFQSVMFCVPAIETTKARRLIGVVAFVGTLLFFFGTAFSIKIVLPYTYKYLYVYSGRFQVESFVSVSNYISLLVTITTGMGVMFELPLISLAVTNCGIISVKMLKSSWRVIIIFIFVISAIITPPDVISMIVVAVPICGLYMVSVVICSITEAKRRRSKSNAANEI